MADSLGLNVVVLPEPPISDLTISWSTIVSSHYKTKFTLDGVNYYPHMTLYQSSFPSENLSKIISLLLDLAKTVQPFPIHFNRIDPYVDYLFYLAQISPSLQTLHEQLIDLLNPLRDQNYTIPLAVLKQFPSFFAQNVTKYGTALAKDDYLPHITLSRLDSTTNATLAASTLSSKRSTVRVSEICLTNVDHDGTCTKILERFRFAKELR